MTTHLTSLRLTQGIDIPGLSYARIVRSEWT